MGSAKSHSILVMENNPLVLQDIVAIIEATMTRARVEIVRSLAEVDTALLDRVDITLMVLSTSPEILRNSPTARTIRDTGCKVILLDGSDLATAGLTDGWVCIDKPFSQDTLSSAIRTLLCRVVPSRGTFSRDAG